MLLPAGAVDLWWWRTCWAYDGQTEPWGRQERTVSRTRGRWGWPKITCLIGTRKTYARTCKNTREDTKVQSFSESGWEMGKGTECAHVNRPSQSVCGGPFRSLLGKSTEEAWLSGRWFWRAVRQEKVEQTLGTWEFMAISCQNWEHPWVTFIPFGISNWHHLTGKWKAETWFYNCF